MSGHHIQADVKLIEFNDQSGKKLRRFMYTTIEGASRIRALRIYEKYRQVNLGFVDYLIEKFPSVLTPSARTTGTNSKPSSIGRWRISA